MNRFLVLSICATIQAGLTSVPAAAAVAARASQEHTPMLIDKIPADMWRGQRALQQTDYPQEQESVRADVARFIQGRFRTTGDRLFVIPPDQGFVLRDNMFMLGGPSQFQKINSTLAFSHRPLVRPIPDARTGSEFGNTSITVGVTLSGEKIYTAITLSGIAGSDDELIGYFQLEPVVADPTRGW